MELARSKVREETGRLSPSQSVTAFRLSSMVYCDRTAFLIIIWQSSISRFRSE